MYVHHFNFQESPFSIAPNPRYLYLSPQHREALAHLLFGISEGGGFIALTGEVGTGKTTLCRCLLDQLPENVDIALIFNPRLNPRELLASICDELQILYPEAQASLRKLIALLNDHLLASHARGRRTIVLIDEAQNLSLDVLEQIRLLTNLETNQAKLLEIMLVGQPELCGLLARSELRQLAQRITARYHLLPLSPRETGEYIVHRLAVAGCYVPVFSRFAMLEIYRRSTGIPRLINLLCDRALLGAYTLGRTTVTRSIVRKAARELLPPVPGTSSRRRRIVSASAAVVLLGAGFAASDLLPSPEWASPLRLRTAQSEVSQSMAKPPQAPAPKRNAPKSETAAATSTPQPPPAIASKEAPKPAAAALALVEPAPPVAATKPPIPPPPAPDIRQALADPAFTQGAALLRLASLWKLEPAGGLGDPCDFIQKYGLRCLFSEASWPQLRSLDYPAVLEFTLPDLGTRYATLVHLDGNRAELDLGTRTAIFGLENILPFWKNHSVLIWKPPAGEAKPVSLGSTADIVEWVKERLHVPAPPGQERYFDADLRLRIMAYQLERGLAADGVVGPQTVLYLSSTAGDPEIPRLRPVSP